MRTPHRVLRIALAGWMSLVVLCPGISGMVLCVGEDGHVALEADHAGHCLPSEHPAPPVDCDAACDDHGCTGLELTATACGGHACVDVDLASDHALPLVMKTRPASRPRTSPTDLLPAPQLLADRVDPRAGRSWRHGRRHPGSSPSLDAQRTPVLRI